MWFLIYLLIGVLFGFIFLGVSKGMLSIGLITKYDFDNYKGLAFLVGITWIVVVPVMIILMILLVVKEISKHAYEEYTND